MNTTVNIFIVYEEENCIIWLTVSINKTYCNSYESDKKKCLIEKMSDRKNV